VANKDINDLELGFLYPIVEVREKHLFGYDRALVPAEQLEHAIFLAGQMDHSIIDRHDTGIQVHHRRRLAEPERLNVDPAHRILIGQE
jgi:hypothetical protein